MFGPRLVRAGVRNDHVWLRLILDIVAPVGGRQFVDAVRFLGDTGSGTLATLKSPVSGSTSSSMTAVGLSLRKGSRWWSWDWWSSGIRRCWRSSTARHWPRWLAAMGWSVRLSTIGCAVMARRIWLGWWIRARSRRPVLIRCWLRSRCGSRLPRTRPGHRRLHQSPKRCLPGEGDATTEQRSRYLDGAGPPETEAGAPPRHGVVRHHRLSCDASLFRWTLRICRSCWHGSSGFRLDRWPTEGESQKRWILPRGDR